MEVTRSNPVVLVHLGERPMGKENDASESRRYLEEWRRQLETLDLGHHLVDSAAAFLANAKPTHQGSQHFVSRFRRCVYEPLGVHEGLARVCDLDSVFEDTPQIR